MIDLLWRTFAHAAARKLAYALVGILLLSCGITRAEATTISEAWTQANNLRTTWPITCRNSSSKGQLRNFVLTNDTVGKNINAQADCWYVNPPNPEQLLGHYNFNFHYDVGCSAPTPDFDMTDGVCKDLNAACRALNDEPGRIDMLGQTETRGFRNRCAANGCNFGVKPGTVSICTGGALLGGKQVCSGEYEWTGKCPSPAAPPAVDPPKTDVEPPQPSPDKFCEVYASGQKVCSSRGGKTCYTSSNGNVTCWNPGETGTKTDGPIAQTRTPGTVTQPDTTTGPKGDTLTKTGTPVTTETKTYDKNGNVTNTSVTTVMNFGTSSGTDAGNTNDGEPDDAPGEGEGEGGTATGGAGCAPTDKPITNGGDAATNMVVTQAWATRCAVEAGNAVKVTGDVTDCSQPYTVTGGEGIVNGSGANQHDNVEKLKAIRRQICPDDAADGTKGKGTDNYGLGNTDAAEKLERDGVVGGNFDGGGTGDLDDAGMGYVRSCPTIPAVEVFGHMVNFDTGPFCTWLQIGGQLVLLMAALASLRIMMPSGS